MVGRQTHPVKCLPWGLKDPESDLQKPHNNRARVVLAWGCSVEKWKQGLWDSLDSQPGPLEEFQASEKPCLEETQWVAF